MAKSELRRGRAPRPASWPAPLVQSEWPIPPPPPLPTGLVDAGSLDDDDALLLSRAGLARPRRLRRLFVGLLASALLASAALGLNRLGSDGLRAARSAFVATCARITSSWARVTSAGGPSRTASGAAAAATIAPPNIATASVAAGAAGLSVAAPASVRTSLGQASEPPVVSVWALPIARDAPPVRPTPRVPRGPARPSAAPQLSHRN